MRYYLQHFLFSFILFLNFLSLFETFLCNAFDNANLVWFFWCSFINDTKSPGSYDFPNCVLFFNIVDLLYLQFLISFFSIVSTEWFIWIFWWVISNFLITKLNLFSLDTPLIIRIFLFHPPCTSLNRILLTFTHILPVFLFLFPIGNSIICLCNFLYLVICFFVKFRRFLSALALTRWIAFFISHTFIYI